MTIDPDFEKPHRFQPDYEGKTKRLMVQEWNAAIEAAANKVESAGNILLAHSIRELKK